MALGPTQLAKDKNLTQARQIWTAIIELYSTDPIPATEYVQTAKQSLNETIPKGESPP